MKQTKPEQSLNGSTSAEMATEYADRALNGAPTMTETEAQILWRLCGQIVRASQNAEHSAFMLLSEIQAEQSPSNEFRDGCTREMAEVAKQMRQVRALLTGGIEALWKREGVAA